AVGASLRLSLAARIRLLGNERHWAANTAGLQLSQLRQNLTRAKSTEFGKRHDFAKLIELDNTELLDAYRKALPPRDWYAFADDIKRMREGGEPDILWPGKVRDFAQTSGTTAGDKFIPVTQDMLASNRRAALDIFAHLHRFGVSLPKLTSGKLLFLGGCSDIEESSVGTRTADLSGLVAPLIRWPLSEVYSPGPDIALLDHWPTKIEAMAKRCIDQDIRFVSGMPSWTTVLFQRIIELAGERGQAATCVKDVWPNLTALIHGGVNYAPFAPRIARLWSGDASTDIPHRHELYPASEGFIALQDRAGDPGLRLLADIGNFYEFIPLEQIDDDNPPAFTPDQCEPGQRYVVCMTTCAGLYRYIIGDVVEFDTRPAPLRTKPTAEHGPARLRIVGRHRHFINAFGENLIVEHIERAVAHAASAADIEVGEFTAAPVYPSETNRAGLELAIEVPPSADPRALEHFAEAFDARLKAENVDYTTKRTDSLGMAPPTLTPLPPGTFHRWLDSMGKLGGQHKCPRCANHREII
ncbi:MAG: GH3 auxin-responsive promoter family protein, partial [Planctomycetota bacterium]